MPAELIPDSCEAGEDETQLDDDVFFGNTALVLGILLAIFLVHVTIISVVEAYWLAQVRGHDCCLQRCWISCNLGGRRFSARRRRIAAETRLAPRRRGFASVYSTRWCSEQKRCAVVWGS